MASRWLDSLGGGCQEARVPSGHRTLVSTEHDLVPEVSFVPHASLKLHSIYIKLHSAISQTVVHTSFKLHYNLSNCRLHIFQAALCNFSNCSPHIFQAALYKLSKCSPRIFQVALHASLWSHSTHRFSCIPYISKVAFVNFSSCTPNTSQVALYTSLNLHSIRPLKPRTLHYPFLKLHSACL